MTVKPDATEFAATYKDGRAQVMWTDLVADTETPVTALLKLAAGTQCSFLLESVEGGTTRGRYSIIGVRPDVIWRCSGDTAEVARSSGATLPVDFQIQKKAALASLLDLVRESRIGLPDDLPPMASALVGYAGYDMVRLLEGIPDENPDTLGIPDGMFVRPTIMAVFDSVKDVVTVVTPVFPRKIVTAKSAYAKAAKRLEEAVAAFEGALPAPGAKPAAHAAPGLAPMADAAPAPDLPPEVAKQVRRLTDLFIGVTPLQVREWLRAWAARAAEARMLERSVAAIRFDVLLLPPPRPAEGDGAAPLPGQPPPEDVALLTENVTGGTPENVKRWIGERTLAAAEAKHLERLVEVTVPDPDAAPAEEKDHEEEEEAAAKPEAAENSAAEPQPEAEPAPAPVPAPDDLLPPEGSTAPVSNTTRERYHEMVAKAKEYIVAGDVFQVVPSQRFRVRFDRPPLALYRALRRLNPSPYLFLLDFGGFAIAGSSPELLVRVRDDAVTIRPIAGTRPRGADKTEDERLAAEMLADPKERAEHLMLLDLGRNDVGRVAEIGTVHVTEQMMVERYSHVMHIVSNVEGRIDPGFDAMHALWAGFPAGTVSGAPKVRAMEIIDELESERRGFYAGAIGYFAADGSMDTCIALRTALLKDGIMVVQAGGGVVADSDPDAEYEESCNKAKALLRAAEEASEEAPTV